jgi:hypothetical protein
MTRNSPMDRAPNRDAGFLLRLRQPHSTTQPGDQRGWFARTLAFPDNLAVGNDDLYA